MVWDQPGFMAGDGASEAVPPPRTILAMQFGDHCWLRGLQSRPELNGHRVMLDKWLDDKQRWRCKPQNWTFDEEHISVKPKNLSKDPEPLWQIRPTVRLPAGVQITPENTEVVLVNAKDFEDLGIEKPAPLPRETVASWMLQKGDEDCGAHVAASLRRSSSARASFARLQGETVGHIGTVSMEDTCVTCSAKRPCSRRRSTCSLCAVSIRSCRRGNEAREHLKHMKPVKEAVGKGARSLDFWEDPEEVPENDPSCNDGLSVFNRASAPMR